MELEKREQRQHTRAGASEREAAVAMLRHAAAEGGFHSRTSAFGSEPL